MVSLFKRQLNIITCIYKNYWNISTKILFIFRSLPSIHFYFKYQLTCMLYALLLEGWTMTLTPFFTSFLTWRGLSGALLSHTLMVSRRMAMTFGPSDINRWATSCCGDRSLEQNFCVVVFHILPKVTALVVNFNSNATYLFPMQWIYVTIF